MSRLEHLAASGFPTLRQLAMLDALGSGRLSSLTTSPHRLAKVLGGHNRRAAVAEQVAHIANANEAAAVDDEGPAISAETLETINGLVFGMEPFRTSVRSRQIWAGTSRTPRAAEYVPPPPARLRDLADDFCAFLARTDVPPLAQAAIAHAQFSTICPFYDGNGRTGRCLIHVVLRRRGLISTALVPISAVLAISRQAYLQGLQAYRDGQVIEYCVEFASAIERAVEQAAALAAQCEQTSRRWRGQLGRIRSGSAAERLLPVLFDRPVLDAKQAEQALRVSDEAARLGLMALEKAGIIRRLGATPTAGHG